MTALSPVNYRNNTKPQTGITRQERGEITGMKPSNWEDWTILPSRSFSLSMVLLQDLHDDRADFAYSTLQGLAGAVAIALEPSPRADAEDQWRKEGGDYRPFTKEEAVWIDRSLTVTSLLDQLATEHWTLISCFVEACIGSLWAWREGIVRRKWPGRALPMPARPGLNDPALSSIVRLHSN